MLRVCLLTALLLTTARLLADDARPLPSLDPAVQRSLASYLEGNYRSPEDYIVESFENHDVVLLGEAHRFRQCPELVQQLIPSLYAHGIYSLGLEFGCFEDQALIDSLLASNSFDSSLAYQIVFNQWPYMGYKEYIDIYRVAWQLNAGLPGGARRFRILGLNAKGDFSLLKSSADVMDPAVMRKVRKAGPRDSVMANVILQITADPGEKMLVFCGFGHAFTKFHWPAEGPRKCSAFTDEIGTTGNRVYEAIGDRCMFVFIHAPWISGNSGGNGLVYPADGIIDTLMLTLRPQHRRVGFDVIGSPFANLSGEQSYWSFYVKDFRLGDFCDGYIYLGPLSSYKGVTVADGFITEANRVKAIMQSGNPEARDTSQTVDDIVKSMARDADIEHRFRNLR